MRLLLAGGGTGGHLIPGLSVAEALARRDPDANVWLFGTSRPIDSDLATRARLPLIRQAVRPFSPRPWRWPGFYVAWRRSCRTARLFIEEHEPDVVLGLGGYASGPAVSMAAKLGIPTAILNPDAIPGRANRYLARRVDRVFCQWGVTVEHMPTPARCRVVGCPTRAGLEKLGQLACRRELGLDGHYPLLLVSGASLGAATINRAVGPALAKVASRVDRPWQVLHQTGPGGESARLSGLAADCFRYRAVEFIDRMPEAIASADLVLCRAGASTLAELTAIGRASILLPYPYHRDEHQRFNGRVLVKGGAAIMLRDLRDAEANADQVAGPLAELMTDPARRRGMGDAARALGRPDAADRVLEDLASLRRP